MSKDERKATRAEQEVVGQLINLAEAIRGGKRVELAPAASHWEIKLKARHKQLALALTQKK